MSFDEEARTWDLDPKKTERASALAKEILKNIEFTPTMVAMEFGCGTGILSFQLKDVFSEITLVDTSAGMIEVLQEKIRNNKLKHFHPLLIDLLAEPLPKVQFDIIYTLMTLHHIRDIKRILEVFHQLLKPGAWLCIADLEKEEGSFHNDPHFDGHNGFEQEELAHLLHLAGFEEIQYTVFYEIRRENEGKPETYPLFLLIARKN